MKNIYAIIGVVLVLLIGVGLYAYYKGNPLQSSQQQLGPMFTLESSAFESGESIPTKYTCDAESMSPPLSIKNVPLGTKSMVLLVHDPDVSKELIPSGVFEHWVVYNIPAEISEIPEAAVSGTQGLNGAGETGYAGPCPPAEYEPTEHRYYFRLYAIDTELTFVKSPTTKDVEDAIQGHILGIAELMGNYKRVRGD